MPLTLSDMLTERTYFPVSYSGPSKKWYFNEAEVGQSLRDVVDDLENVHFVMCIEGGKVRNATREAADLWWEINGANVGYDETLPDLVSDYYTAPMSEGMAAATDADFRNDLMWEAAE
jgi:hypothetical protein